MNAHLQAISENDPDGYEIYDDETGKVVGSVKLTPSRRMYHWQVGGVGGYEFTADDCLAKGQAEYDRQKAVAQRERERDALVREAEDGSDPVVQGLMTDLKSSVLALEIELHRNIRRPTAIDAAQVEIDRVREELCGNPIRFRGYTIQPYPGGWWNVSSPTSKYEVASWPTLIEALSYVNEQLA